MFVLVLDLFSVDPFVWMIADLSPLQMQLGVVKTGEEYDVPSARGA